MDVARRHKGFKRFGRFNFFLKPVIIVAQQNHKKESV
jgi:hypothetical protein